MAMTTMTRLFLLALVAVAAAGCGRKAPLDPPPASVMQDDAADVDASTQVEDRPFILDPLL